MLGGTMAFLHPLLATLNKPSLLQIKEYLLYIDETR
jgi:hypothetical protein